MTDRWTGRLIDGRYVVESILGQGGMGVVLKARHKFTSAQVALKMLQPDLMMNADAKARFLAEAQTPTTIGHPGIVMVTDAGETPEGELYLAMELLVGRTLRQAMYPAMPPQVARRILLELLDALGAAHARGIIHRDLKPENVFLVGPASTVKLLDFGIAKVVQAGRTAAGMMLGTLSYMAPEQLSDASSVDARADLWAVGVMIYEMLTGKLPFRGTQLGEIMAALATQEPDPIRAYLPQATPAMVSFFATALSKDRNGRYATAQDMGIGVSAMLIEGTAPPVVSTLNGLGSPRSSQMTAADSGPQIPSRQLPAQHGTANHGVSNHGASNHGASNHGASNHGAPPTAQSSAPGHGTSQPGFAPHVPPPGAPHVPPPGGPSSTPFTAAQPPGTPSAPFTAQHGTPNAFTAQQPATTPHAPFTAQQPATAPHAPFTAQQPSASGGPYGFVDNPPVPAQPGPNSGYGFVNAAPKPSGGGFGSTSWIIIGGVGAALVILILVVNNMMSKDKGWTVEKPNQPAATCASICSFVKGCMTENGAQMDEALCASTCDSEPAVKRCYEESSGVCLAFASCIQAADNSNNNATP